MHEINIMGIQPVTTFNSSEVMYGLSDVGLLEEFNKTKAKSGDKTGTFIAASDDHMVVVMFSNKHPGLIGMAFLDERFKGVKTADELREIAAPFLAHLGFNVTATVSSTDKVTKQEYDPNNRLFGGLN
jgi:hypothetical protein